MNDRQAGDPTFVQITTSVLGSEILLYALDERGDVWRFDDQTRAAATRATIALLEEMLRREAHALVESHRAAAFQLGRRSAEPGG